MAVVTAGGPHALAARRGCVAAMGTRGRYRVSRFYGRNKFLCGERLMVGPDWKGTLVTAVCIIVPAVLYFTITYVRASRRSFFADGWSRVRGLLCGSCSFFFFLDGSAAVRRWLDAGEEHRVGSLWGLQEGRLPWVRLEPLCRMRRRGSAAFTNRPRRFVGGEMAYDLRGCCGAGAVTVAAMLLRSDRACAGRPHCHCGRPGFAHRGELTVVMLLVSRLAFSLRPLDSLFWFVLRAQPAVFDNPVGSRWHHPRFHLGGAAGAGGDQYVPDGHGRSGHPPPFSRGAG